MAETVLGVFVILDSSANLVESFDAEAEARSALSQIREQDPAHADDYALIQYDAAGRPLRRLSYTCLIDG